MTLSLPSFFKNTKSELKKYGRSENYYFVFIFLFFIFYLSSSTLRRELAHLCRKITKEHRSKSA